ncbi:MAG: hypothetical protein ABIH39_02235 [Candidatus Margulisiibacteriota bacterium]
MQKTIKIKVIVCLMVLLLLIISGCGSTQSSNSSSGDDGNGDGGTASLMKLPQNVNMDLPDSLTTQVSSKVMLKGNSLHIQSTYPDIIACPTENIVALRHFFSTIEELGGIPDLIFNGLADSGLPENYEGLVPATANVPFTGDWVSQQSISGNYQYEFVQCTTLNGQSTLVLSANYSLSPVRGYIILNKPKYCHDKILVGTDEPALADDTTMQIKYDYSDSAQKIFKVLIKNMAPDLTGTGNPSYQIIEVVYNSGAGDYVLSSTMIFEDPFTSYPELPTVANLTDTAFMNSFYRYNKGTVLFNARVKSPNSLTIIYTDRATSQTDAVIDISDGAFTVGQYGPIITGTYGSWATPFYIDAASPTPNISDPGWFSNSEQTAVLNLPLWSHNDVKNNSLGL